MTRIFVPQPIPESATDRLRTCGDVTVYEHTDRRISRAELLAAVPGHDVLVALGGIRYDADVMDAAAELRLVAAMHVTARFVELAAATQRGVPVTGIPNLIAHTTAEFTVALILATAWRITEAERFLRDGRWQQRQSMALLGSRLFDKTLGIVGMGAIGRDVARKAHALGMKIRYHNRNRVPAAVEGPLGAEYRSLDELCAESDVVVVTVALTAETQGLIGREQFARMKPTALFVNTSRGHVVDEAALEDALEEGQIRGAGLDVFCDEDPELASPGPSERLKAMPNCVLTPHFGSAARETREEMAGAMVDCVEAFLRGERPPNVLNPEVFDDATG